MDSLQSILVRKDAVINSLLLANRLATDRNKDYQDVFKAQQVKIRGCEDLTKKYDYAYKKLRMREGFMKIGTPVIVVSVAVLAGVGGYYIAKAVK